MKTKITLENEIRFSESMIWNEQKKYYDSKGIDAWGEDVPFYITSNPFIGRQYAQIAIGFIQDWLKKNPGSEESPFYFLELGVGTGQFSFYFLKNLVEFQSILELQHIKIRYVMSDITTKSFDFWKSHHGLKPFIESGILQFLEYDLYQSEKMPFEIKNPLVVIANYLFDSLSTDVFTVNDGQLFESLVTLNTNTSNLKNEKIIDWKKVDITYTEKPVHEKYYNNSFDEILLVYAKQLMESHFQFPAASLEALKNLQLHCSNQFLLLTSDKGYTNLEELDNCDYPELDFHGCFSVMVNYHAIGEYLKKSGGQYVIQSFRENIVTGVFSSGFALDNFPQLQLATKKMISEFSPTDYFLIYEHFIENYKNCSLEVMASYLNLSAWDPNLFDHISEHLCELAFEADPDVISYLETHLHLVADNFYYLPSSDDTLIGIGIFFQNIGKSEKAIHYYELSQLYFGNNDIVLFNKAMCLHQLNRREEAIACLREALALDSNSSDAKEWIEQIQSEA